MCLSLIIILSFSLFGCQKSEFYNQDFSVDFGNTTDNILQGGLMASTDEYLYIPLENGIVEIEKKTGKPIILQDITSEFGYVNVVNGYIFYNAFNNNENKRGLVVQSLDGKFLKQISKMSYFPFVVFGEWIYATNLRGGDLYKINIKDSERIMLAEEPVEEFALHENGIFYSDGNNLYSINLDGENKQKLLSEIKLKSLTYSNKDNTLLFINSDEENGIYAYNINTNKLTDVRDGDYTFVQVFENDTIVTLDSTGLLQSFSLADGHIDFEIPQVTNFQIFNDTLYYFDQFKTVYSITPKNNKPNKVYSLRETN